MRYVTELEIYVCNSNSSSIEDFTIPAYKRIMHTVGIANYYTTNSTDINSLFLEKNVAIPTLIMAS